MHTRFQNIILIGFMGVGKSTLANLLSKRLGWDWVDTDRLIEKEAGCSTPEIFANEGEKGFRELETFVLQSLRDVRQTVVATGGGAILRQENREILSNLGLIIGLFASEDAIWNRVARHQERPLLQTENSRETLHRLLHERLPLYQALADLQIDTSLQSHAKCVAQIMRQWERNAGQHEG